MDGEQEAIAEVEQEIPAIEPVISNTPVPFDAGLLDTLTVDGKPVTIIRDLTVPGAGTPVAHRYVIRG